MDYTIEVLLEYYFEIRREKIIALLEDCIDTLSTDRAKNKFVNHVNELTRTDLIRLANKLINGTGDNFEEEFTLNSVYCAMNRYALQCQNSLWQRIRHYK